MGRQYLQNKRGYTKRKHDTTEVNQSILIVTEGDKTETTYFNWLKKKFRLMSVRLEIVGEGKDPLRVVEASVLRYNSSKKEGNQFDSVYCIVDRDKHKSLNQAKDLCLSKKYSAKFRLILSYPCIEYWFILHFANDTHPYHQPLEDDVSMGKLCKSRLKNKYYSNYSDSDLKTLEKFFAEIDNNRLVAIKRAQSIMDDIVNNDTINPSTMLFVPVIHLTSLATNGLSDVQFQIQAISFQEYEQYILNFFKIFHRQDL
ncbi:MAG: RloB family protein [Neisseriaceae bacterium]